MSHTVARFVSRIPIHTGRHGDQVLGGLPPEIAGRNFGHPRFLAREPWISGGMYIGLGVAAALSSSHRK